MMSLNNILRSSGKKEIRTRKFCMNTSPRLIESKYNITWVVVYAGDSDQDQCAEGYFTGSIDNILDYYEKECDMDESGLAELNELMEVNLLITHYHLR